MIKFAVAAQVFAATVSKAADASYSTTPHEATGGEQSKYDDLCFHCIDEGNIFCTQTTEVQQANFQPGVVLTGKCMAASCEQDTLTG